MQLTPRGTRHQSQVRLVRSETDPAKAAVGPDMPPTVREGTLSRRLATAVIISRIRWVFLPLALVSAFTNTPSPKSLPIFVGIVLLAGTYNLAVALHRRLPPDAVQPLIAFAMGADVIVIAAIMWELSGDPAAITWATLMLAGAAAAALYGWRGVFWYGPLMIAALAVASLVDGLLIKPNGLLTFLQESVEILGVAVIVAVVANENETHRTRAQDALRHLQIMVSGLRGEVAESAKQLSFAADQLVSVTAEQNISVVQTSSSMEELSRTSAAVAGTVDAVSRKSLELQTNLEKAQSDLTASGERTLALASRINEIEDVLDLINDIADQTNLLALNAAIEAARAGDAGRGFAVVADEVRRLADRSKAGSAQIAVLVGGAQAQSRETVMALEKGVKEMELGLTLMRAVANVSGEVQQAAQQERSSTEQVVRAIERIAEGSRAVASTAREISAAATRQGAVAAELAGSWERGRGDLYGT